MFAAGECRSFAAEEHRHLRRPNADDDIVEDYQSDGAIAGNDDDEDLETEPGGGYNGPGTAGGPPPKILTTSQTMYTVQGTTVNLPCLMSEGFRKFLLREYKRSSRVKKPRESSLLTPVLSNNIANSRVNPGNVMEGTTKSVLSRV